ncbi:unnamed protein product [Ixodes hexagonus]
MEETTSDMSRTAAVTGVLILLTPNILVWVVYFVWGLGSSTEKLWKLGMLRFTYDVWTAPGGFTYDVWIWIMLLAVYAAAGILLLPGDVFYGPTMDSRHKPTYRHTAVPYHVLSMGLAGYLLLIKNVPCWPIYRLFPGITVGITGFGLLVCVLLYIKDSVSPSPGESGTTGSRVFDFYWGLELYTRIGKHLDMKAVVHLPRGVGGLAVLCAGQLEGASGAQWLELVDGCVRNLAIILHSKMHLGRRVVQQRLRVC